MLMVWLSVILVPPVIATPFSRAFRLETVRRIKEPGDILDPRDGCPVPT
jgi:hypothetical protein